MRTNGSWTRPLVGWLWCAFGRAEDGFSGGTHNVLGPPINRYEVHRRPERSRSRGHSCIHAPTSARRWPV